MDLFTPQVSEERQHRNFRAFLARGTPAELNVLQGWADGLQDRDGKFVIEFQTTFNSCFWELYLNATFRHLEVDLDFSHSAPDFVCRAFGSEFVAEATIASNADGYAAEWQGEPGQRLPAERKRAMLEYGSIRLANALDGKLRKFRASYSGLAHVSGKPFVVCLAPFEQPYSYLLGDRPLRRLLYGFDMPLYLDDSEGVRHIVGEARVDRVWKESGSPVEFGLFGDARASELSAVIFSSVATFGKVLAAAITDRDRRCPCLVRITARRG